MQNQVGIHKKIPISLHRQLVKLTILNCFNTQKKFIMEDLFRKILYTGVGFVTTASDSVQKSVLELIQKGEISEKEGKKIVTDLEKSVNEKREEFEERLNTMVSLAVEKFNIPTEMPDMPNLPFSKTASLEKRIKSLEIKVGLLTKELDIKKKKPAGVKATAKKAVRKTAKKATATAKKATATAKKATATAKKATATAKKAATTAKRTVTRRRKVTV